MTLPGRAAKLAVLNPARRRRPLLRRGPKRLPPPPLLQPTARRHWHRRNRNARAFNRRKRCPASLASGNLLCSRRLSSARAFSIQTHRARQDRSDHPRPRRAASSANGLSAHSCDMILRRSVPAAVHVDLRYWRDKLFSKAMRTSARQRRINRCDFRERASCP